MHVDAAADDPRIEHIILHDPEHDQEARGVEGVDRTVRPGCSERGDYTDGDWTEQWYKLKYPGQNSKQQRVFETDDSETDRAESRYQNARDQLRPGIGGERGVEVLHHELRTVPPTTDREHSQDEQAK